MSKRVWQVRYQLADGSWWMAGEFGADADGWRVIGSGYHYGEYSIRLYTTVARNQIRRGKFGFQRAQLRLR